MKIAGVSMIRNDADIVEPFVRHTLRVLDHLFIVVHCPQDGTRDILSALQAEGLPITLVLDNEPAFLQGERITWLARQAYAAFQPDYVFALDADEFIVPAERSSIEAALASLPADAVAALIPLRTFVMTRDDPTDEPHPLRRIRHRAREAEQTGKLVLTPAFAVDQNLVVDHGNHSLARIGAEFAELRLPWLRQLALAHYPVRSADQLKNKTVVGYLAHLAAGRPGPENQIIAVHWGRFYKEMIVDGAMQGLPGQQLVGWFYGRRELLPSAEEFVCDPIPAPDTLRYGHLVHNDAYATLARFAEALIRSRPAQLDGVRFGHMPSAVDQTTASESGRRS